MSWLRRLLAAFRPADLVEARRRVAQLEEQNAGLLALLGHARAQQHAAEAANAMHGQMAQDLDARVERALAVLRDTRRGERGRNQEAIEVLAGTGPEPAEGGGDRG